MRSGSGSRPSGGEAAPRPFEFIPPPLDIPNQQQREFPKPYNPYPYSRKCAAEWEAAYEFCDEQEK